MSLLPQEIAEKLSVTEYTALCAKVETKFKQKFSVISIGSTSSNKIVVIVELEDDTQHRLII